MQEAEFPSTLLLGMEGMYGLFIAVPLYMFVAPALGEDTGQALQDVTSSSTALASFGLTLLFTQPTLSHQYK